MSNENEMNIYQKLLAIKDEVPYLKEDKKGHNYDYASPENVFGHINPLLKKHNLCLTEGVKGVDTERITQQTSKGERNHTLYGVKIRYELINADNPEERITKDWFGSGANGAEKGFGSALTYGKRYFLLNLFDIPTGKDDPDNFQRRTEGKSDNGISEDVENEALDAISGAGSLDGLKSIWQQMPKQVKTTKSIQDAKDKRKQELTASENEEN